MRRKSIERMPLTSRKREANDDDDIMKDKRVNILMAPMDTIINKRKRFIKLDMDEDGQVQSTQVKSIQNAKQFLNQMPNYDNPHNTKCKQMLITHVVSSFPLNIRSEK